MAVDAAKLVSKYESLFSDRTMFNTQWHEASRIIDPAAKMHFFQHSSPPPGLKNTEEQWDATSLLAMHRFAAVLESLSTPQGNTWHKLVPVNKRLKNDKRVRMYLDEVTELMFAYRYRARAGFVPGVQNLYGSIGGYGNGTIFIDADPEVPGLRYKFCHLSETYFEENHQGVVDGMFRLLRLPPSKAVELFGQYCPADVAALANTPNGSSWTNRKEFLHVVTRNDAYDPQVVDPSGMRYKSCYIYLQNKSLVREGGYRTFPYAVSRYTQTSGETYGRGPAQWVLPSIKLLNQQKKSLIVQAHRAAEPPLLAFDDGVLSSVTIRPGHVNWGGMSADGRPLVGIVPTGNIAVNEKMMEMERQTINDAFLITLFQILTDNPQMTATEVLERTREKGILIAPTAGRMQSELLGPMIERELDVLMQQGLVPPPPPALAADGGRFNIEYDSPMSRMQRADKAAGFARAVNRAAEYSKMTGDPSPLDWFNFDTAMPELMDIDGAPAAWIADQDMVDQKRQGRAQQAQQQQAIDAAPAMAALLKDKGGLGGMGGGGAPPAGA